MITEYAFPRSVRRFGKLGLLGLLVFGSSIIVLHLIGSDIDLTGHYVSNLANMPFGWIFMSGAFVHGWGNLALTKGLHGALQPGRLRTWGVLLFGLAAVGLLVAALFPIDPPGQVPSLTGGIHHSAASASFVFELFALFIFSAAFGRHRRWRRQRAVSLVLSVGAAMALTGFIISMELDIVPGLTERVALAVFMAWEIWASAQLIRPT